MCKADCLETTRYPAITRKGDTSAAVCSCAARRQCPIMKKRNMYTYFTVRLLFTLPFSLTVSQCSQVEWQICATVDAVLIELVLIGALLPLPFLVRPPKAHSMDITHCQMIKVDQNSLSHHPKATFYLSSVLYCYWILISRRVHVHSFSSSWLVTFTNPMDRGMRKGNFANRQPKGRPHLRHKLGRREKDLSCYCLSLLCAFSFVASHKSSVASFLSIRAAHTLTSSICRARVVCTCTTLCSTDRALSLAVQQYLQQVAVITILLISTSNQGDTQLAIPSPRRHPLNCHCWS